MDTNFPVIRNGDPSPDQVVGSIKGKLSWPGCEKKPAINFSADTEEAAPQLSKLQLPTSQSTEDVNKKWGNAANLYQHLIEQHENKRAEKFAGVFIDQLTQTGLFDYKQAETIVLGHLTKQPSVEHHSDTQPQPAMHNCPDLSQ